MGDATKLLAIVLRKDNFFLPYSNGFCGKKHYLSP